MGVTMMPFQPQVRVGIVDGGSFGLRLEGVYDVDASEDSVCYCPTSNDCYAEVSGIKIGKDFHWQREMTQRFHGRIMIKRVNDEKSILINMLSAEEYLESVISSEMNPNAHPEFLKVHAIISRSWLLKMLRMPRIKRSQDFTSRNGEIISWTDVEAHSDYDVCADDHCQRYQGITRVNDAAIRAVRQTSGIILADDNDNIVDARFSKCCGGRSELFSSAWQNVDFDYLQPIDETYCDPAQMTHDEKEKIIHTILNDFDAETDDFFAWTTEVSASDVKRNLMTKFNVAIGDVINLKASKRGPSGRIVELLVEGSNGNIVIGKELNIRRLLSDSHLYSSAFEAEKIINDKGEIVFRLVGRGWGHGVGLCQIGAAIMAERGYSYIDILKHYYNGVKLEKIY